jgi:hypothetical protein
MRIVTTLLSLLLASATLGGCAARARVRVGDANSTDNASKIAADDKKAAPAKTEGQGSAEAPAAEPASETQLQDVPSHD